MWELRSVCFEARDYIVTAVVVLFALLAWCYVNGRFYVFIPVITIPSISSRWAMK